MRKLIIALGLTGLILGLSACDLGDLGDSKYVEPFKDAPVSGHNDGPAIIGTMPDGFNNWAAKCDGPNRVYTIYHAGTTNSGASTANYGALAVVPNDPRCHP